MISKPVTSNKIRVGVLGFDGINGLDLFGPLEAFANALSAQPDGSTASPYEAVIIAQRTAPFLTESQVRVLPHCTLDEAPPIDTLIVPGGHGLRRPETNAVLSQWLRANAPQARRVASVCTGLYGLAPTGLLDGLRVTTHWRFAEDVQQRFPALKVDGKALFIKQGKYSTGGGISAGIDLALSLIEEDLGPSAALAAAREMIVYLKRPGGQEQYSEPLRFQSQCVDGFAELVPWIAAHLQHDLSVEALAAHTHLSPRQFSRRFRASLGCTPAEFVERLRMDEARRRLLSSVDTVDRVAASLGFNSADVFRRGFARRFGIAPGSYRERFTSTATC